MNFSEEGSYSFITCTGHLGNHGDYKIPFIVSNNKRVCKEGDKVGVMVQFTDGLATISFNVRDEWKVAFEGVKGPLFPAVSLEKESMISLLTY